MKSPVVILTTLLPLTSSVAFAKPVAAASDDFSLEERGRGENWDNGNNHWGGDHDHHENWCKVKKPYWYHKYPCDQSGIVGKSSVGDNFAPVCKYQNWYKNSKGWWVKDEFKPPRCVVNVGKCP
ncbi:hypothetical protein N7532_001504 [Penicillium argentinense]|uniref:Secreted protein n=1 Tax=Penicillium argentinense TaxID=1131581 RepID=A0A9W9KLB3_9EURO|nr:uncharacterized protein N7532_001504 [Penicillium argentinense]KAJ5110969.1 hypothetical protein N7532_001504 [Penicillium argentinense]